MKSLTDLILSVGPSTFFFKMSISSLSSLFRLFKRSIYRFCKNEYKKIGFDLYALKMGLLLIGPFFVFVQRHLVVVLINSLFLSFLTVNDSDSNLLSWNCFFHCFITWVFKNKVQIASIMFKIIKKISD